MTQKRFARTGSLWTRFDKGLCLLGRVCKLQQQDDRPEQPYGSVVVHALLVARVNAPYLLDAVDEALHHVAKPVDGAVERSDTPLVSPTRDGVADASAAQVAPGLAAAVGLVPHQPGRANPRPPPPRARHRVLFEERLKHGRLVLLPGREEHRHGLASTFDSYMYLRAEAPLAAA